MINYNAINKQQLIFSITELKDKGFTLYNINKLINKGILKKLNKKYYENLLFEENEHEFYYIQAYVPNGVICLISAAVYYNLTTFRPDAIDVAIKRKDKVSTFPIWPDLNVHYYTDERFELAITKVTEGNNYFYIYDLEKTVVDTIYYREKIGIEETKEILINYLNRPDRNINKLVRYSKMMKCNEILTNYLEVLL